MDLVLWTEVVNAFFDQIKELPLEKDSKRPAFGLRVAFPGHDTSANAKADVALTFNSDQTFDLDAPKDFESRLNKKIVAALTGVDVFVNVDYRFSVSSDEAADILANLKLRLFDGSDKEFVPLHHTQSYFCFSPLPVDPEFGSDFRLRADMMEGYSYGGKKIDIMLTDPEGQYVPVRQGVRTRLNLNLTAIVRKEGLTWQEALEGYQKALKAKGGEQIPGAPAAISMLFQKFVGENFLLGAIMQRLPANPGLHLGVVQINGSGLQPLWSVRLLLKSPELDRRPRFVSRGTIQLQCLTLASPGGMVQPHYIKIIWSGRADPTQLELQARPIIESPWGFGAGVVPSVSPALYAVGASYKLFHVCEVFAGAGIRKDHPTSFVYGVTLDVENILGALFGKVTSPEGQNPIRALSPRGKVGKSPKQTVCPQRPAARAIKHDRESTTFSSIGRLNGGIP